MIPPKKIDVRRGDLPRGSLDPKTNRGWIDEQKYFKNQEETY
jgi:hypothetical protein